MQGLGGLDCNGDKFTVSKAYIRNMRRDMTRFQSFVLHIIFRKLRSTEEISNSGSLNKSPPAAGPSGEFTLAARLSETRMTGPMASTNATDKSIM